MKKFPVVFLCTSILMLLLISCNDNNSKKLNREKKWESEGQAVNITSLPSISFEEMKNIYETCDFIDLIFYNVDFSMSINTKSNIQRTVGFIATNAAKLNPACQAMGRVFFQRNGELLIEADMYFDEQCQYFVFLKNGKPAFANDLNPQGRAYFSQVFSQVKVETITQ